MLTVLNRFSWLLSLVIGFGIGFFFAGFEQSSYRTISEVFSEGWWMLSFILSFLIKRFFLSESFILQHISEENSNIIQTYVSQEPAPFNASKGDTVESYERKEEIITPLLQQDALEEDTDYIAYNSIVDASLVTEVAEDKSSSHLPKEPSWIVSFFSDRPLAKIGGILLFLGVVYFFSLIWNHMGPVEKVLIGFVFGFSFYGIGIWMDKKGNISESRTLLGVGIAVNAFTILSARWLLGGPDFNFSDTLTLVFLLLNTILSIITGLVYGSRTFLVFSFVFGYIIPFICGGKADTPYTLLGYNALITAAGYILASRISILNTFHKENASWLMNVLIAGSFLVGLSNIYTIQTSGDLVGYFIVMLGLIGFGMLIDLKNFSSKYLTALMISGYTTIAFLLIGKSITGTLSIFILGIIPLFCASLFQIISLGITLVLSWLIFVPLFFGVFLIFIFGLPSLMLVIPFIFVLYFIAIIVLSDRIPQLLQLFVFVGIAFFLFTCGVTIQSDAIPVQSDVDRLILASAGIIFFLFSTGFSLKRKIQNLSLIAMISTLFILALVLSPMWSLSWILLGIFVLCAGASPFLPQEKIPGTHSVIHIVLLAIFIVSEIAFLGQNIWFAAQSDGSSGLMTLGFIYLICSVITTFYALALVRISTGIPLLEMEKLSNESKNLTYGLLAVPVSLFSLAIAVIFSDNPGVVASVWILESTILALLYRKNRSNFILLGSILLIVTGLIKLIPFFDTVHPRDWLSLAPMSIIMIALSASVRLISPRKSNLQNVFDILHIVGMVSVLAAFMQIIPVSIYGFSILGAGVLVYILAQVYKRIDSDLIALWLTFLIGSAILSHISRIGFENLSTDIVSLIIQLSGLLLVMVVSWSFLKWHRFGILSFVITSIGALIITSIYVNILTENVFAVTIYLTAVATCFIVRGIHIERPYYRTIGLYIGIFVLAKIFIYDLWTGFDDGGIRVLAFMITGGVMIAISQLYGKSVKRSWNDELSFMNFAGLYSIDSQIFSQTTPLNQEMPFSDEVAEHLKKIDISRVSLIRFIGNDGKIFTSKRAGIMRITLYIIQNMKKSDFSSNELSHVFEQISPHLNSNLSKDILEKLLLDIQNWIKTGGSVEIINKN